MSRKVLDYQIVRGLAHEVTEQVLNYVKQGYELNGKLMEHVPQFSTKTSLYAQGVVKYKV